MSYIVARTCTEIPQNDTRQERASLSRPLAAFRTVPAYVLLGDPGSGKSTSFEAERDVLGEDACLVTARDFLVLEPNAHPEWRGKTLFIDGLDEVRAGSADARTPFDELRRRLDSLGRPRFRLSCREADWLGPNDRTNLARVTPDASLTVLRLDPLTEDDIKRILNARSGIDDARSFMATAKEKGVAGFLDNPQCLNMLADVVTAGEGWPGSRLELFEQACRRMVREHNPGHRAAARAAMTIPEDDLLDAAGRLCAVLLISGAAGCATVPEREDADYPDLSRCARECREQCYQAVSTKLFTSAEGRCQPVHRHVAEFLAGRHLARLIERDRRNGRAVRHGIPALRIVALLTGHDGEVVTALRGLSAWIAAYSRDVRSELIQRDAIDVTLYGDAGRFSTSEKVELLKSLASESGKLEEHLREAAFNPTKSISAAGTLVEPETEQALRGILIDPRREDAQQTFVLFVLHALRHGARLPGLTAELLNVVRDNDRWPGVQRTALDALSHGGHGNEEFIASLKGLLNDVRAGDISDPDDYLLGTLLTELYPGHLSPPDVWLHLTDSASAFFGRYFTFWASHLVDNCLEVELAEHLDVLVARQQELRPALKSRSLQDVPAALLARGLEVHGDYIETQRKYDWLGLALMSDPNADAIGRVRTWLTRRPDNQKAVLLEGLKRASRLDDDGFRRCSGESERGRYRADLPQDFGSWCMEQATAWVDRDRRVAEYFLQRAWSSVQVGAGARGLSLEVLEQRTREHVVLRAIYTSISDDDAKNRQEIECLERDLRRYGDAEEQRHQEWLLWVRSNATALRENRCTPPLLHQLASAYFGYLVGAEGTDPRTRLRSILRNDRDLEDAALRGLRGAIRRDDLPEVEEIVRLRDENQEHPLGSPILASLAEIHGTEPCELDELSRSQIQRALALYFCTRGIAEPPWYRWVIRSHARVVSEVLVRAATSRLRRGDESVNGVHAVASRADHVEVARHAVLSLLRAAAIRGAAKHSDLNGLLWAALRYSARKPLLALIDRKLSRTSMSVAQRVRWLAAGLVAAPRDYLGTLESYVSASLRRVEHLAAFFDAGAAAPTRVEEWKGRTFFSQSSDDAHRGSVAAFWAERLGALALNRLVCLTGRTVSPTRVAVI